MPQARFAPSASLYAQRPLNEGAPRRLMFRWFSSSCRGRFVSAGLYGLVPGSVRFRRLALQAVCFPVAFAIGTGATCEGVPLLRAFCALCGTSVCSVAFQGLPWCLRVLLLAVQASGAVSSSECTVLCHPGVKSVRTTDTFGKFGFHPSSVSDAVVRRVARVRPWLG